MNILVKSYVLIRKTEIGTNVLLFSHRHNPKQCHMGRCCLFKNCRRIYLYVMFYRHLRSIQNIHVNRTTLKQTSTFLNANYTMTIVGNAHWATDERTRINVSEVKFS